MSMYTFALDFISSTYRYKKKALHPFIHLNANVPNSFVDFFVSKWHLKYLMIFSCCFFTQHYSFNPFVESVVSPQLCVLYTFASPHFLSPQEYDDIVVVYAGTQEGLKIKGALSNGVGIICFLVELGLFYLAKTEGGHCHPPGSYSPVQYTQHSMQR